VGHPAQWKWTGYHELMGDRQRYRLLDRDQLLWLLNTRDLAELRRSYQESLGDRIERHELARDPRWTERVAVGGKEDVERVKVGLGLGTGLEVVALDEPGGTWVLRSAEGG
jgi:hypothetical protein